MSPSGGVLLRDEARQKCPVTGPLGGGRRRSPGHVNRARLHGTEKAHQRRFHGSWQGGEILFQQFSCQHPQQRSRQLAFRGGAGCQSLPALLQSGAARRRQFLVVLKNHDAQRRVQAEFGLPHGRAQREPELFKLAQGLHRGISPVVADRFKRAEARPYQFLRRGRSRGGHYDHCVNPCPHAVEYSTNSA